MNKIFVYALKKLELLSAVALSNCYMYAPNSCSVNFPHASITWYMHAKHEPVL